MISRLTDQIEGLSPIERELAELLEPEIISEGFVLVDLVCRNEERGSVLRLVIDKPEGGVTISECVAINRQIGDLLDVEDVISGRYNLEVGSPGATRKLKSGRDYELFAGRGALVLAMDADGKHVEHRGVLKGLQGEDVLIETQERVVAIPMGDVIKARLEISF